MDIINHLKRTVSPAVLGDERTAQNESLLEQFYATFVARLTDKETYGHFAGQNIASDDSTLFERVWVDDAHRRTITRELANSHDVDEATAKGLIVAATPLAYQEINSLAGSTPVPQFLRENLSSYQQYIPSWAATVIPVGLLGGAAAAEGHHISDTVSHAPLHSEKQEEKGSFMKALLPIIALIIFGALAWALLRGCQKQPEPVATPVPVTTEPAVEEVEEVATPVPVVDAEAASLRIASGEGNTLYACHMNVGDEALQSTVMNAMMSVFVNEAQKCRADVDDDFATDMPAAEYLPAILTLIKDTPDVSAIIKGNEVIVNGPDAARLEQLVADIKQAAPNMNVSIEGPLDIQREVEDSLTAADTAIGRLGDNPDPRDVARALSLQVINFEVDKAIIPDVNKPLLDRAVTIMKQVPDMKLQIVGHTDKTASAEYNMKLSQERAKSVRDYLVAQGADPDKLTIKGAGETDPIADNSTEQGRFRNRRIEFTITDETNDANIDVSEIVPDNVAVNGVIDPDLNPLDADNDDLLPDSDDPTQGTVLDPNAEK